MGTTFYVEPGGVLNGTCRVPGDKSISHRAIMFGALANGVTDVSGFLEGEDTLATLAAFRQMGVTIEKPGPGQVRIHGVGLHGLQAPAGPLDLGNSGTSMRLLSGLMAGQAFASELIGDASLSTRPMARVTRPLTDMGAVIETAADGRPPLKISPATQLHGIHYAMPVASAQVKSCLLLAGMYADGQTCVQEPGPSRDHTERMLTGFGYAVERHDAQVCLHGGGTLRATNVDVPADISSATFFMVGAAISPGSRVLLEHVGINPTRAGVIDLLRRMGAGVSLGNERQVSGEPVADITVTGGPLHGIDIGAEDVALAIDEFPALFVAASCAEGMTRVTGARELRVKESDRIQVMADGLQTLGVDARPADDGMSIQGLGADGRFGGGDIDSHGDHRIAMSFAMAALRAGSALTIQDCDNVNTSFPGFVPLAAAAGLGIRAGQA